MSKPRIKYGAHKGKWYRRDAIGNEGSGYSPREAFDKWLNIIIVQEWHHRMRRACPPGILRSMFADDIRGLYRHGH